MCRLLSAKEAGGGKLKHKSGAGCFQNIGNKKILEILPSDTKKLIVTVTFPLTVLFTHMRAFKFISLSIHSFTCSIKQLLRICLVPPGTHKGH